MSCLNVFINKYLPTSLFNIYKSINTLFEINLMIMIIVDGRLQTIFRMFTTIIVFISYFYSILFLNATQFDVSKLILQYTIHTRTQLHNLTVNNYYSILFS